MIREWVAAMRRGCCLLVLCCVWTLSGTLDRYVWIYTEQPQWWPVAQLPEPYVDAMRQAKQATVTVSGPLTSR